MTDDVLQAIYERNAAYKQFIRERSQSNHTAYKISSNNTVK